MSSSRTSNLDEGRRAVFPINVSDVYNRSFIPMPVFGGHDLGKIHRIEGKDAASSQKCQSVESKEDGGDESFSRVRSTSSHLYSTYVPATITIISLAFFLKILMHPIMTRPLSQHPPFRRAPYLFTLIAFFPVASALEFREKCSAAVYTCPLNGLPLDSCYSGDCGDLRVPDEDTKACIKRSLLGESHRWNDVAGLGVWFFGAGLAISVGVGGGGIYVPLGVLLLRFGPKAATGLSQVGPMVT